MNIHSTFDRETFQQLLANSFAVQESQINARALSDIMEVQRSVARGKLDLDGAMRHIVESARNVAHAAGVAIALLDGDHLTYRAGSGTGAACIGLQVTASLIVSADPKTNREILRVENAQTDPRIEADICWQFGANSLLILPIYRDGAVAGVLDVRFREAHAFQDREVSTYRLMAEQIEAALFHAAHLEQKESLAPELPPIPEAFAQIPLPDENFVPPPEFTMLPENEHSLYARCGAVLADVKQFPVFKQSVSLATTIAQRAKELRWPGGWRSPAPAAARELTSAFKRSAVLATMLAQRARNLSWPNRRLSMALAVAVVLAFTALIAYRGRGPAKPLESSTLPTPTAIHQQAHLPKPLPGKSASAAQSALKETAPARTALKRVRVGPSEVDYVANDVTMRVFTNQPAAKRRHPPDSRVAQFGDDVTVRYFTPPPPSPRAASR